MQSLKGRTAVVTGAAAGIGQAMVRRFAAEGMRVVVADIDEGGARRLADELITGGKEALAVRVDVTVPADLDRLADEAFDRFGSVDVLCNNAGVLGRVLESWKQPSENWRWVFDVNVHGVVDGVRAFLPRMLAQESGGYVLNTGSIAGLITGPFFAHYNASKHAVVAYSECLHHELRQIGSNVRVGVLCPGWVNTGLASLEQKLPAQLREANAGVEPAPLVLERDRGVRQMVSESVDPDRIAEIVVEAVREGRFYVFPHPERKADFEKRSEEILDEIEPRFPPVGRES